jgi:hypothetical protein
MEKLNATLQKLFYYNPDHMIYIRDNPKLQTPIMQTEFMWVIETQFGSFISTDWIAVEVDDISDQIDSHCICTHSISNLFYITHIPSDMTFQVGSECVRKLNTELDEGLGTILKKRRNKKKGNTCHYCDEPLIDLRRVYQRDGYCNRQCYAKMSYVVPFGKHSGKILVELICTKIGRSYTNWVKQMIKQDSSAFSRYPLFLEIIEENEIMDTVF